MAGLVLTAGRLLPLRRRGSTGLLGSTSDTARTLLLRSWDGGHIGRLGPSTRPATTRCLEAGVACDAWRLAGRNLRSKLSTNRWQGRIVQPRVGHRWSDIRQLP